MLPETLAAGIVNTLLTMLQAHVFAMFLSFSTRETVFPATKYVYAVKQKNILPLETMLQRG